MEAVVAVDVLGDRGCFGWTPYPEQRIGIEYEGSSHGPNQPILLLSSAAPAHSGVVISARRSGHTR